ncbi:hypothetical protein PT286_07060 [Neisseriaceae bacterium ESL0693]|nr:hypothetical protein [Neisseriaceae bacterium ESL0693]
MSEFFNVEVLRSYSPEVFNAVHPFPHHLFKNILLPEAFDELYQDFPSLNLFEKHVNLIRGKSGQRPHNRYYMAYERSIYHNKRHGLADSAVGVATMDNLPPVWQRFMQEIFTSEDYRLFLMRLLGCAPDEYKIRYAWHVGETDSEVSPHVDSPDKIGTHIFYFNTRDDWHLEWGGSILALGDKKVPQTNPDISDFGQIQSFDIRDNSSFLFKNTGNGWHGVEKLTCPANHYRRLFNVIVQKKHDDRKHGLKKIIHALLGRK